MENIARIILDLAQLAKAAPGDFKPMIGTQIQAVTAAADGVEGPRFQLRRGQGFVCVNVSVESTNKDTAVTTGANWVMPKPVYMQWVRVEATDIQLSATVGITGATDYPHLFAYLASGDDIICPTFNFTDVVAIQTNKYPFNFASRALGFIVPGPVAQRLMAFMPQYSN